MEKETEIDAEEAGSRIIVRLELTPRAKDQLHELAQRRGMTHLSVCSRLMDWFGTQEQTVQAAILGHYPHHIKTDLVELILKHMTSPMRKR